MMHFEVEGFLKRCEEHVNFDGAVVVDIGSRDNNGTARNLVPATWKSWTGIDAVDGLGVDVVGDAEEVLRRWAPRTVDIFVTTELLEHARNWRQILVQATYAARPGGWLIVTCAGRGREPHRADGEPGGPLHDEHYRNIALSELVDFLEPMWTIVLAEEGPPGDTRVLARRPSGRRK